jgi:microcin C transport system permease protein
MSPLLRRRLQNFRANRRGYISFWLLMATVLISILAPLIANDRPIIMSFNNHLFFPVLQDLPETYFGGDFETIADYRDPYVQNLIKQQGWMIWPIIEYRYDTINYNLSSPAPSPPDTENFLGTDDQGRDVLARLIYGIRISLAFAFILTTLSSMIGIAAGAVQGFFGGMTDLIFQRFMEVWSGMPVLYLLIIMASVIAPGFWSLLILLLLFSWMALVGVVRAEFLRVRNFDYVRAARALGVDDITIMWRHILPNALVATISLLPFIISSGVTTLTSLDFLGFGLPPGSPSLGELLSQGKANLQAPWLSLTAFFSLAFLLSILTFVGEAVRDAFDPRKVG